MRPRSLTRRLDAVWIDAQPLDAGTVAQYVHLGLGDAYRIQVNAALPPGLHAAAVRHLIEAHQRDCTTVYCERARDWLGEAKPATAQQASRSA
mgnify:CR=1 FL=1